MKADTLKEIKDINSRIRVVFATTALGMGVDAPIMSRVIHMNLPTNIESYAQEIGMAGRSWQQVYAILFYNINDLSSESMDDLMRRHCQSSKCLRQQLFGYFGFNTNTQYMCCSVRNKDVHAPEQIANEVEKTAT